MSMINIYFRILVPSKEKKIYLEIIVANNRNSVSHSLLYNFYIFSVLDKSQNVLK